MFRLLINLFRLELKRAGRQVSDWSLVWVFFLLIVSIFAIGLGAHQEKVTPHQGAGIIWVSVLFAMLFSFERLWRQDLEQGILFQYLIRSASIPFLLVVFLKIGIYWLFAGLPLLGCSLLGLILLELPLSLWPNLALSLFLGTQILSIQVAFGTALTLNLKRAGLLTSLLLLPLYLPILIFGSAIFQYESLGLSSQSAGYFLIAFWLATGLGFPKLIDLAVKHALHNLG